LLTKYLLILNRMKKLFFEVLSLLILTGMITSCSKSKESDSAEKFSTLSVEANKATVEDAGIDFIAVMTQMKSIETVDVIVNLGDILSSGSKGYLLSKNSKLFNTLETFTATAKGEKKLNDLFNAMISSKGLTEDPESLKEFWDSNVGTYTWNKNIKDWDIVLGGPEFKFLFPSTDVATTNDATLRVFNYKGINISNPIDDEYTGDLPISLNAELKKGNKVLITFVFGATYNTDGVPKAVASDLTVENYKFEVDISNDTKLVSVDYKFMQNDKIIMEMGAAGNGLFTDANYNSNTITHTETNSYTDYIWNPVTQQYVPTIVTYTNEWEETDFEEILNSSSANFQLFNIAIRGDINVKGLVDQLDLIDKDLDNKVITDETAQNRYAAKINEFMNLRLVNITSNEIMAKAEAYVVKEISYGYTDFYIDFRLTFKDGSPIDAETYFNAGFNSFVNELNRLIRDINSEYDLGIDPVDY
jgi:hypothetical protein